MAPGTTRYSRHELLSVFGERGQERIEASRVFVAGLGALGSLISMLLARAGVGFLRVADQDAPELHNLHRQILYDEADTTSGLSKAQVAEKRLTELVDKYGWEYVEDGSRQLMDYSERRLRAEIAEIPDGKYHFKHFLEDDGVSDEMIPVEVTIVVKGDEVIVDFTGSAPQVKGPINCTWVVAASSTYIPLLSLTDPFIPRNSGAFRPIKIIAR